VEHRHRAGEADGQQADRTTRLPWVRPGEPRRQEPLAGGGAEDERDAADPRQRVEQDRDADTGRHHQRRATAER
jgi:hypothetical protein